MLISTTIIKSKSYAKPISEAFYRIKRILVSSWDLRTNYVLITYREN